MDIVVSIGIGFRDMENPGNGPGQGVRAVMGSVRDIVEEGGGDLPQFDEIGRSRPSSFCTRRVCGCWRAENWSSSVLKR